MRILVFLLIFLPSLAYADCAQRAYLSVGADIATTAIGLHNGAREANPLLGSDVGTKELAISALVRGAAIYLIDHDQEAAEINCYLAALTFGVAANNMAVISGADMAESLAVGVVVTFLLWPRESD